MLWVFERIYLVVESIALLALAGAALVLLANRNTTRRLRVSFVSDLFVIGLFVTTLLIAFSLWALMSDQLQLLVLTQALILLLISFGLLVGVRMITATYRQLTEQLRRRIDAETNLQNHQDHLQQLIARRTEALREEIASRSELQQSLAEYARTMESDLAFAARTQNAMQTPIPHCAFAAISAQSFARDQVNGDLYHTVMAPDGSLLVLVGDAMGHGAAAGFMTVMMRSALSNLKSDLPPFVLLEKLNGVLRAQDTGIYLTAVLAKIYPDGLCLVSHAGHPSSLHWSASDKAVTQLDQGGFALGMFGQDGAYYEQDEIRLAAGDRLLLYSDGIAEASNPSGVEFGLARVQSAFEKSVDLGLHEAALSMLDAMYDHCAGTPISDDVTLLALEFGPQDQPA